jgi:DNA mismatch repair ATPase MutS
MKVFLMDKNRDLDLEQPLPVNEQTLMQDLELDTLINAMASGDRFLWNVAKKVVLCSLQDPDAIRYRQDVLRDCLRNPAVIREMYQISIESLENKRKNWLGIYTASHNPSGILNDALKMMDMFFVLLKRLKQIADEHADNFQSEGFTRFFAMIQRELDDAYFATVENHLKELRFRNGVLISAELGMGNEGKGHILRKPNSKNKNWMKEIFAQNNPYYTFYISDRDDHGARALAEYRERGMILVANALAQSADHIDSFLTLMRNELAFYMGCLNLADQLAQIGQPVAFPVPAAAREREHAFHGLYDVCLALTKKQTIVGNEVNADQKDLVIITGANQGGKTTFMRSIGLAQLMMQCGLFVGADSFRANVCAGLFTHYKRKEDATMKSGKLDEELSRMSEIIDHLAPNCMVLFNESFAATNEREGSEIARQITSALLDRHIKVFFVTHQYEFAHSFYDRHLDNTIFLRAGRQTDGGRNFKIVPGEPLQTSYGEDIYSEVFTSGQEGKPETVKESSN